MSRLCIVLAIVMTAGCSTTDVLLAHRVDLVEAGETIPEDELLDVGIVLFDPGLPEGEIDRDTRERLIREGIFQHIRRAESVHMAMQLRDALQRSRRWGSVWVTPEASTAAELTITAKILESDGYAVRLAVAAVDATGRKWIDREYELETAASAYDGPRYAHLDPYQDIYHSIANDLAAAQQELSAAHVREIRTVGALRYAAGLSPEAFAGYVGERRGIYAPERLPAHDDPMFERTKAIRERERLFLQTLDQHYGQLVLRADEPYMAWRSYAREESIAVREATRSARWRAGLGAFMMVASILYGGGGDPMSFSESVLRDSALLVGVELLNMRATSLEGKAMHAAALEELSLSFDDEVKPMVIELEGVQHRLVGTAEAQYAELRDLLRRLLAAERGAAVDPQSGTSIEPDRDFASRE